MGSQTTYKFSGSLIIGGSNLESLLESSEISRDLRGRIAEAPRITVPPLRERREDILPLAEFFLERSCRTAIPPKPSKRLSPEAKKRLVAYSWPENVGQLEMMMRRLSSEPKLELDVRDLPEYVRSYAPLPNTAVEQPEPSAEQVLSALDASENERARAVHRLYKIPSGTRYEGPGGVQTYVKRLNALITRYSKDPVFEAKVRDINSQGGRRKK